MNYRYIISLIGRITLICAAFMLVPAVMSAIGGDGATVAFASALAAMLLLGALSFLIKPRTKTLYPRDGFAIVALAWILMSLFGALPFYISGYVPDFSAAFFETVSGFTTTGATALTDIEALPRSLLFWRSLTHWIGGMGILVFMLAVLPSSNADMMHIMKAEVPAPRTDKLVARTQLTAQILYGIYFAMTALQTVLLLLGGLDLYDSLTLSFSTAGTGGFAAYNDSIAHFGSLYVEVVVTVFMLLFSINFNIFFLIILGHPIRALKNEELKWFGGIVLLASAVITLNVSPLYDSVGDALRDAVFQVASVISTTGFITADFTSGAFAAGNIGWPQLSQTVILMLMFFGACAGSTGGGMKISRVIILLKSAVREVKRLRNPRAVLRVKLDKKPIDEELVTGTAGFFAIYCGILMLSTLLISVDGFEFTTNFTAGVSCLNNIGPTLGQIGATGSFAVYSPFSKVVLSFVMLAGRLNIFPIVMLFAPKAWKRNI